MTSSRIAAALALALAALPLQAQQAAGPPAVDRILGGRPDTLFTIGDATGEDWELLSSVRQVAFDGEDNLYILDAGNHRVLVFDAGGRFVRQIGRRGDGPGEFLQPIGMAVTTDGFLFVADAGRGGHAVFDLAGAYVRNITWDPRAGSPAWGAEDATEVILVAHPRGGVVMRLNALVAPPTRNAGRDATSSATSPLVWYRTDGTTATLFEIPQPHPFPMWVSPSYVSFTGFVPPTLWCVLPGGEVAVAWNAAYSIAVASGPRAVTRVIQRAIPPRPVTERDSDRARQEIRTAMDLDGPAPPPKPGGQEAIRTRILEAIRDMAFMDVIPVLRTLYADPLGRVWVERAPVEQGGSGLVDLFSADGTYLGSARGQEVPDAVSASGRAAYVRRDEFDVQRVVVTRLPSAWR